MRRFWLLPLAALIAVLPLLTGGHSCGKDFAFHMQSWLGAADQLRHGVLYPRWNFLAAYNAGDPRFIFYPPLSWMLGALLTLVLPFNAVPTALTWIILTVAGFSMYRLARAFAPEPIALFAACVFLANPFMLWTVTGRNAYAELLAAAFCPLLLEAMLSSRISSFRIGPPLALLWLSNVPGGVIATYLVIFLAAVRLLILARKLTPLPWHERMKILMFPFLIYAGGLIYGLALAAFYLLPALSQRRSIHMAEAFGTHLRPTDNLFFHRALEPTDAFFVRTEHVGLTLAVLTLALLCLGWRNALRRRHAETITSSQSLTLATVLSLAVILLTTFLSAPLWRTLPALWVVQFPWRLLFVLGACLALSVALLLRHVRVRPLPAALAGLVLTAVLSYGVIRATRTVCTNDLKPPALQAELLRHHTPEPTDEYVVATGDPDFLRPDNPPFWLASTPAAYAPGTTPNPAATDPTQEWPLVPETAQLDATPLHFSVDAPGPGFLVVNLQDYPGWRITRNGGEALAHLPRPDGLLTVALPAGPATISISWRHGWDEYLGAAVSLLALLAALLLHARTRLSRIGTPPNLQPPN